MGEFSKTSTVPFCSLLSSLQNWQDAKMPETRSPMSHTNRPASMSRDHSPCQLPHHRRCAICDTLIQVLGYTLLVSGYFDNRLERNPNLERDFPTTSPSSPLLTLAPPLSHGALHAMPRTGHFSLELWLHVLYILIYFPLI